MKALLAKKRNCEHLDRKSALNDMNDDYEKREIEVEELGEDEPKEFQDEEEKEFHNHCVQNRCSRGVRLVILPKRNSHRSEWL
jgi:hypothetical protein